MVKRKTTKKAKKKPIVKSITSAPRSVFSLFKFWGPNPADRMHNRRNLAFFSAVFALVIWPHELLALHIFFDIKIDLIKAMLVYVGTVAGTSIGGYIWSAMKEPPKQEAE